jgi:hypothetical protein
MLIGCKSEKDEMFTGVFWVHESNGTGPKATGWTGDGVLMDLVVGEGGYRSYVL